MCYDDDYREEFDVMETLSEMFETTSDEETIEALLNYLDRD